MVTSTVDAPNALQRVGPGLYDMPAPAYHADPCQEPSLSSSIAKILCLSSPMHARMMHPRLNPQAVPEEAERFDVGEAAHAVLLEGAAAVQVIDAKDWRTNAAKDARDAARLAGKIPLLPHAWKDVEAMAIAARRQLLDHTDGGQEMFRDGKPEQTLVWLEADGTWCRARLDWLRFSAPGAAVDDYKTTGGSANPEAWTRTMFGLGFDIQVAWYRRGVRAVFEQDSSFRFAVQETTPPYALSVVGLGPDALMLAEKKVLYALEAWRECLRTKTWPGFPHNTCWASLPAWEESRWLDKETHGQSFG